MSAHLSWGANIFILKSYRWDHQLASFQWFLFLELILGLARVSIILFQISRYEKSMEDWMLLGRLVAWPWLGFHLIFKIVSFFSSSFLRATFSFWICLFHLWARNSLVFRFWFGESMSQVYRAGVRILERQPSGPFSGFSANRWWVSILSRGVTFIFGLEISTSGV
jgi:hypothetical protein